MFYFEGKVGVIVRFGLKKLLTIRPSLKVECKHDLNRDLRPAGYKGGKNTNPYKTS